MSILLTTPTKNSSQENDTTIVDINSTNTVIVDSHDGTTCPSAKWLISYKNLTNNNTESLECHAVHDFSRNVSFTLSNDIGTFMDMDVDCIINAGDTIDLEIQNNEPNIVQVCVVKMN